MLRARDRSIIQTLVSSFGSYRREPQVALRPSARSSYARILAQADMQPALILRYCCVVVIGAAICGLFIGWLSSVPALITGCLAIVMTVKRRARQRSDELERDLPALLTSVASSVRAGIDPLSALAAAQEFFPPTSTIARELGRFNRDLVAGADEEVLVRDLMSNIANPDLELFKRCLTLSRRHGTSLADPLHRIVRVVRQRQSFRRKTRAALAMHRMSAIGIAFCATAIGGIQAVMNGAGITIAWAHPVGSKLMIGGVCLISLGVVWMMSMGKEEKL